MSKKFIIISVPNAWRILKLLIQGSFEFKFYGLPINKPKDRHKWFFNYDQALNFIRKRGEINDFTFKFHIPIPFVPFGLKYHLMNLFFRYYYKNQFGLNNSSYSSVWVLLQKV